MMDQDCPHCRGLGWVCENHPRMAWSDDAEGCQCGAGMPCDCQGEEVEEPVIIEIISEVH